MSCSNTEKYSDFCGLLTCPNCGKPLDLGVPTRRCASGHCFDRTAKGGYVHLLRQARRGSSDPGDSAEMCAARTRFLEGNWYLPLRERVAEEAMALRPADVLDAGCGEGWYTAALCEKMTRTRICGIDLSKYALRHAGRTCPRAEFAVASIFELPLADASVDLVTHLFAPMADKEFCRVLRPGGHLMTVTPGARHLWGLKSALYEKPYENPTEVRTLDGFEFVREITVDDEITLTDPRDIEALFKMTPYAWKTGKDAVARLLAMPALTTPISFQIHIYRKK